MYKNQLHNFYTPTTIFKLKAKSEHNSIYNSHTKNKTPTKKNPRNTYNQEDERSLQGGLQNTAKKKS